MNGQKRIHTILIAMDSPEDLRIFKDILNPFYQLQAAQDGRQALEIASSASAPDLILLDVKMHGMDASEVIRQLKTDARTTKIPVILTAAESSVEDEIRGFELGAVDYIIRPVSPPIVLARVKTQLELKATKKALEEENIKLASKVRERTEELALTRDAIILSLTSLTETRGHETAGHLHRTQNYVRALAERLAAHPEYSTFLDAKMTDLLFLSAPLHDIGKVSVPDSILLKPAKLTPEEFEVMKKHTTHGRDALSQVEQAFRGKPTAPFLSLAAVIAYSHHEKWNGTGYPEGIAGHSIPIPGRLMAVADVYDALITKRVYKPAFEPAEAEEIISQAKGILFDPDIVDAFLKSREEFRNIASQYPDIG